MIEIPGPTCSRASSSILEHRDRPPFSFFPFKQTVPYNDFEMLHSQFEPSLDRFWTSCIIYGNTFFRGPAEKPVNGLVEALAEDVPKGIVHTA
ncbi:MAG: hypothetical protein VYC82_06825 [Verrucomicrobiota bacterium]|nr:hypothetical protein [Verrucomicrobiota bacterium]